MGRSHNHFFDPRLVGILLGAALVLLPGEDVAGAVEGEADAGVLSVPAEFVYTLRLPGLDDHVRRPAALFVDHAHGEVIVGDSGFNRLLIFDRDGLYRYEFDLADQVGSVVDLAVDSSGFMYVLGTSQRGRLVLKYDFDGVFLEECDLGDIDPYYIESMTIDDQDRLVIIEQTGLCTVVDSTGQVLSRFDTSAGLPDADALEIVRGKPRVHQGLLYLPVSTQGTVLVFELASGQARPQIGFKGNTAGQLNFPVAVDVTPSGVVVVLDKMRFNVLCFTTSGRFLGEFGGKGYRDGWMYHPTLLAAVSENRVIVGQILDQRIQVLQMPQFVFERLPREAVPGRDADEESEVLPESDPQSP